MMAPSPHIHRNALRRPEQAAADDMIGAEQGRTDFQHPVAGRETRANPVAHESVERA